MNKKQKKNLILLLASVFILLMVLLLPDTDQQGKTVTIPKIDTKRINRIELVRQEDKVEVIKNGDEWIVKGNLEYPANMTKVKELWIDFDEERIGEWISGSEAYTQYGLSDDLKTIVTYYDTDEKLISYEVGRAANRANSFYIKLENNKNIYQTTGLHRAYTSTESELRNNVIAKIPTDEIISMTLKNQNNTFVINKEVIEASSDGNDTNKVSTTPTHKWVNEAGKEYYPEAVNDILNTISHLEAVDFVDEKPTLEENPLSILTIETKTEPKSNPIKIIIHKIEAVEYLISIGSKDVWFKISELDGNRLIADLPFK